MGIQCVRRKPARISHARFDHPQVLSVPLFPSRLFCSWVTAWVNRSSTPRKADRLPMENFNSGKEKIDTALVQTLPEKQAIKTVPLTESKGAAQARWMTPPRSNGALSVLNHPIAKADTAQREPPSMPTIADHSPALTECATLLTALAKPCMPLPFPMRDVDAISSLSRNTAKHNMSHTLCQASIRLYSTCNKNDFVIFTHKETLCGFKF